MARVLKLNKCEVRLVPFFRGEISHLGTGNSKGKLNNVSLRSNIIKGPFALKTFLCAITVNRDNGKPSFQKAITLQCGPKIVEKRADLFS